MPGEKRFRTSFMGGFKKVDVNSYIEKILREFDDKLKEKDDEIVSLKNQSKDIRVKYEELTKKADQINDDRSKIADVLIKAQEKAELMLEDARIEAIEEKYPGMLQSWWEPQRNPSIKEPKLEKLPPKPKLSGMELFQQYRQTHEKQ